MREMLFGEPMRFDELLTSLRALETRVNG